MPSTKILIALRVEPPLYERIVARARADGRSPSNYVAQYLRKGLAGEARQEVARHGPVIDTSGMFAQRPSALTPARPGVVPAAEQPQEDEEVELPRRMPATEEIHRQVFGREMVSKDSAPKPAFDPDECYRAYMEAGESIEDAVFSVREYCKEFGVEGWVAPEERL